MRRITFSGIHATTKQKITFPAINGPMIFFPQTKGYEWKFGLPSVWVQIGCAHCVSRCISRTPLSIGQFFSSFFYYGVILFYVVFLLYYIVISKNLSTIQIKHKCNHMGKCKNDKWTSYAFETNQITRRSSWFGVFVSHWKKNIG